MVILGVHNDSTDRVGVADIHTFSTSYCHNVIINALIRDFTNVQKTNNYFTCRYVLCINNQYRYIHLLVLILSMKISIFSITMSIIKTIHDVIITKIDITCISTFITILDTSFRNNR